MPKSKFVKGKVKMRRDVLRREMHLVFPELAVNGSLKERLRYHQKKFPSLIHGPLCGEAADEIERLQADKAAISETASHYLHEIELSRSASVRAERAEGERLLVEATARLKEMVALCDRQAAELKRLRAVAKAVRSILDVE